MGYAKLFVELICKVEIWPSLSVTWMKECRRHTHFISNNIVAKFNEIRIGPLAIVERSHVSMTMMVIVPQRMRVHRKKI